MRSHGDVAVDPLDHCSVNVALYGAGQNRWAMTERGRRDVTRDATHLTIGPSAIEWVNSGDSLRLRLKLDEVCAPLPRRIRGTIEVDCGQPRSDHTRHRVDLDEAGRHRWGVIAPRARITVALEAPHCAWTGSAYVDSNRGDAPLEHDFTDWTWSRAHLADGSTAVVYDVTRHGGSKLAVAHRFDEAGGVSTFDAPPVASLPTTRWGVERATRSEPSTPPAVTMSMESGPFYTRSVVEARWLGQPVTCLHEQLSLQRFERRWVRALLPFRMPRKWF